MNKPASLLFASILLFPFAVLGSSNLQFDGETYAKQFTNDTAEIRLVEYVRANETVKNWAKLVAIRNYTELSDPESAAGDLARTLQRQNPEAKFQVLTSPDGSEAQIDFLTWTAGSDSMEFNIHRYFKAEGYPGLISYQFAYRLTDTSPQGMETFKENRQRWLLAMIRARFDIDFSQ